MSTGVKTEASPPDKQPVLSPARLRPRGLCQLLSETKDKQFQSDLHMKTAVVRTLCWQTFRSHLAPPSSTGRKQLITQRNIRIDDQILVSLGD